MSQNIIEFTVPFEGTPDKPIAVTLYAFDEQGNMVTSAPIVNNATKLQLTDDQAKKVRLVLAPNPPAEMANQKIDFNNIQRRQAYKTEWSFNPANRKYTLSPIPTINWKLWLWCTCQVKGSVVRKVAIGSTPQDLPIYNAKVHICEVDPVWLILRRLPDPQIFKIRDEFVKAIGKPIPQPPDPGPIFETDVLDYSAENIARMNMKMPIRKKTAMVRLSSPTHIVAPQVLSLPTETKKALASTAVETVKQVLTANIHLIYPFFCYWNWLWPFYYLRSYEITSVLTDKQGNFQANIWYLCNGDHPDLFFWVEYQIGGAWTTVYNPGIYCGTHWNYPCGSQVTITITDPRVPWYSDPTPVLGKQVAVLSIGHDVSMTEIKYHSAGAQEGLTNFNEPFGGSLEPTVWFGNNLNPSVTHYRWSYRRITKADGTVVSDSWHAIDYAVIRHYGEIMADGTLIFKPYLLGPDPAIPGMSLFKIPPQNPPNNPAAIASSWAPQVDARENTASAFFLSYLLEGANPLDAAGKYELKLELFRYDSATNIVKTLNLTDEGIILNVPTVDAPFGSGVVPTTAIPNTPALPHQDIEDRVFRDVITKKILAFRLVLFVDNNPCVAEIYSTQVTGPTPSIPSTVGSCGFIQYPPMAQAIISFKAAHPNNFASFNFNIVKGSSGYVDPACAPVPPLMANVGDTNVNGFLRSPTSIYSKQMTIASLVGACPNGTAAFAENLSVWPLATDGWSTLWYLASYATPMAFALQPQGP